MRGEFGGGKEGGKTERQRLREHEVGTENQGDGGELDPNTLYKSKSRKKTSEMAQ